MSGDWKSLLRTLAPTVATALGGPLAGMATKMLGTALLGDENATQDDIATALASGDPEVYAKIKQINADFEVQMKKLAINVKELEVKDRDSARQLAIRNMWPQAVLSSLFIGGYTGIMISLLTKTLDIQGSQLTLVSALIGVLTAGVTQIMNFWFGSSSGSKEKTNLLGVGK